MYIIALHGRTITLNDQDDDYSVSQKMAVLLLSSSCSSNRRGKVAQISNMIKIVHIFVHSNLYFRIGSNYYYMFANFSHLWSLGVLSLKDQRVILGR